MESLLTFNVPLPFGNVTVATAFLILVYIILTGLLQLGIELVSFTLSMDDKDSLIKKPKNILFNIIPENLLLKPRKVIEEGEYYLVKSFIPFNYIDLNHPQHVWDKKDYFFKDCKTLDKGKAERIASECKIINLDFIKVILLIDLVIFLAGIAFIPTISIAITLTTVFSVRMLSKKVWKNVAKGKKRLDGHDKDISEIKDKMGEK